MFLQVSFTQLVIVVTICEVIQRMSRSTTGLYYDSDISNYIRV